MTVSSPVAKKRSDYQTPDFLISHVDMIFHLDTNNTRVITTCQFERNGQHNRPLVLDGESVKLVSVKLNNDALNDYTVTEEQLSIATNENSFSLCVETLINPIENKTLEGLYFSAGAYCTQCEAEGFRKITYFLDRPDVLAKYDVTIIADKVRYPHLLSNGNQIDKGQLEDGRHWVKWQDPFNKPSYLFALVAGDFDLLTDNFTTQSGRNVVLELYVDKGALDKGHHAISSLKKAMAWDEQVFGLEYDLDIYMVVAVDFFNMGAMENKGLNVFNSKFVLADAQSATDDDFFNIEAVIGHEYFHNWTGNRVTCRDWFQLSLKEGLTVFRDQQFSADMSSPVFNRIKNVQIIREHQFAEDASAMAHPIRPEEVIEMNNFYTVTVYDKGSEVIRMMHTLLGECGFRKGMDLYFARFDGQAVTCDDFVQAMQDATDIDLSQFRLWYSQSGTPKVTVTDDFDASSGLYTLTFCQNTLATADQSIKQALHIPFRFELLDSNGTSISDDSVPELNAKMIELTQAKHEISVSGLNEKPTPSLLLNFSAPIKVDYPYTHQQLSHIILHSSDEFSRWDASQSLYSRCIHNLAADPDSPDEALFDSMLVAVKGIFSVADANPALAAAMLSIPSFETLSQQVDEIQVEALYHAQRSIGNLIATSLSGEWLALYQKQIVGRYQYQSDDVDKRRLRNLSLSYLVRADAPQASELLVAQFEKADNMTDSMGVLKAAQHGSVDQFDKLMTQFEARWRHDPLVLDKWFALHANMERSDILVRLPLLLSHEKFSIDNPNRVRSVLGSFAFYNVLGFHAIDGSGYQFVADYILKLNSVNPQVAARIITPLTQWQKFDSKRQELMRYQLARIADCKTLSKDLIEKVSKSLNYTTH
jgi:aminopeptidase N